MWILSSLIVTYCVILWEMLIDVLIIIVVIADIRCNTVRHFIVKIILLRNYIWSACQTTAKLYVFKHINICFLERNALWS